MEYTVVAEIIFHSRASKKFCHLFSGAGHPFLLNLDENADKSSWIPVRHSPLSAQSEAN